eukprot:TRINITY_DN8600_c1_g1_i1.p1 TRINITY_DN8600_c1_g1~~TRINITY_DN8600_c1_g1_i1.p1  ORF type:complete len:253 (-),score=34.50 TRINITY_DN8600_c1_g1_i1:54-812(-)
MARCRQCLQRLSLEDVSTPTTELSDTSRRGSCVEEGSTESSPFRINVDSFSGTSPVMFNLTIRNGDAVWQIRRRFRQVRSLHGSLCTALQSTSLGRSLPMPPPRATFRSTVFGQTDRQFLQERAKQIEQYLRSLTAIIPCVEQCEALYMFLCYLHLPRWRGDRVLVGGGAPPVEPAAVEKLPRATPEATPEAGEAKAVFCVVCQDAMDPKEDVRVLPCGHEFHYKCISSWLTKRNTCCVCNGPAVLSAPHFK